MIESPFVRGDVWIIDFGADPTDPEQAFLRPAVIVSDDRLHHPRLRMVIVVPGTTTVRDVALHEVVDPDVHNGLAATTAFQGEQIRAVSSVRLLERLGRLDATARFGLDEILRAALRLA